MYDFILESPCLSELSEKEGDKKSSIEEENVDRNIIHSALGTPVHEISEERLSVSNSAKVKLQIKDKKEVSCNQTEKRDNSYKNHSDIVLADNFTVVSDEKNFRISPKRIHCAEDSNVDTDNPLKRARLEFTEKSNGIRMNVVDNNNSKTSQTNIDSTTEDISYDQQSQDLDDSLEDDGSSDLSFSNFANQTLYLGSQLSLNLNSQNTELRLSPCIELETQNHLMHTLINGDIPGCSFPESDQTENIDTLTNNKEDNSIDIDIFTLTDSQDETSVNKLQSSNDDDDLNIKKFTLTNTQLKSSMNEIAKVNINTLNTECFTLIDTQEETIVNKVKNSNDMLKFTLTDSELETKSYRSDNSNYLLQGVNDGTLNSETFTLTDSQDDMLVVSDVSRTSSSNLDLA